MSPISLGLDGLLALLLVAALAVGVRLNAKLKVLRASQGEFAKAVADLDVAAGRAEAGLAALRIATQEAHDQLLDRIGTARELAPRLDRATTEAIAAAVRAEEAAHAADGSARRARDSAKLAEVRAAAPPPVVAAPSAPIPFPALRERRDAAPVGLREALAAAERIVLAEAPEAAALTLSPLDAGQDEAAGRLARFVARRRGARA